MELEPMLTIRTLAVSAALSLFIAAGAVAQTPAPATTAPAAAPPAAAAPAPSAPAPATAATTAPAKKKAAVAKGERTPESLACSAEADKANVHGKERKGYMSKCKAAAKKAVKAGAPAAAPAAAPAKKG